MPSVICTSLLGTSRVRVLERSTRTYGTRRQRQQLVSRRSRGRWDCRQRQISDLEQVSHFESIRDGNRAMSSATVEKRHKAIVHVDLHVAVEERQARAFRRE